MLVNVSFSKMKRELSFSFVLSWIDLGHWLNDEVKFHSASEEKQGQNKEVSLHSSRICSKQRPIKRQRRNSRLSLIYL